MPHQEQELRSRTQKQPNSPPAKSKVESNKSEKKPHVIMWLFGLVVGTIQFLIGVVIVLMFGIYMFYGGGSAFPNNDIVGDPLYDTSSLEKLIDLPFPPGNIAVSSTGRIFFTLHPEAHPPHSVYELKRTAANFEPYPSAAYQDNLISVLSIRIARDPEGNEILWILDYAHHGILHTPKLIGINIATNEEVHRHEFSSSVAPALAMMNDFQVDEAEQVIYIADAGIFRRRGGIIVYDIATQSEKRVLDGHPSVQAKKYKTSINSTDYKGDMIVLGVFTVRPNVDSIVLSRDGKWLYFASVNDNELHKVFTADLRDVHLSDEELAKRVTVFSNKTQSDGMTIDNEGNIYYGDMENSAILRINMKHKTPITETLFQDDQLLRWPDGFSYGPDGYIYFTCSSLQHVIFKSAAHISENAPYHIFRFKSEFSAQPGQ